MRLILDTDNENERVFTTNENGEVVEYKPPYASVDYATKEEFEALQELIQIGQRMRWIPADQPPKVGENGESEYILLSFDNFSLPVIGLYQKEKDGSGAYYNGDEDRSLCSYGLFVNAWMPLPEPYKEDE